MEGEVAVAWWLPALLAIVLAGCVFVCYVAASRLRRGRPLLRRRRRRPVPWGPGGAILAVYALANAALFLVLDTTDVEAAQPPDGIEARLTLGAAAIYASVYALLAWIAIVGLRVGGARAPDFGWPYDRTDWIGPLVRDARHGVAGWLAMLPPVYLIQIVLVVLLEQPSSHPAIEQIHRDPTGQLLVATAMMAVAVAPLFEELVFRVLLQGWLERVAGSRRAWWPIVVSSLAFAGAHTGQGFAPIPLFVLSLGFGYVYRQTHRFASCAAMHAAFNGFSLLYAIGVVPN